MGPKKAPTENATQSVKKSVKKDGKKEHREADMKHSQCTFTKYLNKYTMTLEYQRNQWL